jgi:hypothetical protein
MRESADRRKLRTYTLGNLDGTFAALVAARNQKEACELMGSTVGEFRRYGVRATVDPELIEVAMREPGKVWYRRIGTGDRWESPRPPYRQIWQ